MKHPLPAGSGFLCNLNDPNVNYYYPPEAKEPWSFVYLCFQNAGDWVRDMNASLGYIYTIPSDCAFLRQIERFCQKENVNLVLSLDTGVNLVTLLFSEICRAQEGTTTRSHGQHLVHQAITTMQNRVESSDGASEIAARLGVSVEHLCRVFRSEMNISPLVFFQRQKLRHASALLREGQTPIKEIAQRLGISNVANFNRLFQRHMGIPPGKFRDSTGPVFEPLEKE